MMKRTLTACAALAASLTASAFSGKTLYHYTAYHAAFWPKHNNWAATAENYRKVALDNLTGVPFDTLVVEPVFGFGSLAALLTSADYPTHQPGADSRWLRNYSNAMPALAKAGVDPLGETVKWCRQNKREVVVSLPVNPRIHGYEKPSAKKPIGAWGNYLWPSFKTKNPDATMCPDDTSNVAFGSRYDVDYGNAKVRDKFTANAKEILGKYDLDGFLVDFMRHPMLFRTVAEGGKAEAKDLAALTQMMQGIGSACKAAAARLGHPVTFGVRVPDSVGYCKDVGIDLQGWLDAKLLDAVVLGGPFQLNRWNVTGDLVRKAGIPYYASFTASGIYVGNDSGYADDDERLPRQSKPTFSARIADAALCKASGCMYTMALHFERGIRHGEIAPFGAKTAAQNDKNYFVNYTNEGEAGRYLKDGAKYCTLETLKSSAPVPLGKGAVKRTVYVWEDAATLKATGPEAPKAILVTEVSIPSGVETVVTLNGKEYSPYKKKAGTQWYEVPLAAVHHGANEVSVKSKGKNRRNEIAKVGNFAILIRHPKKEGAK